MTRPVCRLIAAVCLCAAGLCAACLPASGQIRPSAITQLQAATVRISAAGGGISSGVFVTPTSEILTASHGIPQGTREIRIRLTDGTSHPAVLLERDVQADIALLRLQPAAPADQAGPPLPAPAWLPLALSSPAPGEILVALGYPARESSAHPPAIRLGTVRTADPTSLRTSCMLTVGDSGGPLINRLGQLAGLHCRIGAGPESNLHVAPQSLKKLLRQAKIEQPPQPTPLPPLWDTPSQWQLSPAMLSQVASSTLELIAHPSSTEVLGLATRLDPRFASAKLSLLPPGLPLHGRFSSGTVRLLQIVRSNPSLDLAILECSDWQSLPPLNLLPAATPQLGDVVFAVTGLNTTDGQCRMIGPGVIARVDHTEPAAMSRLGIQLQQQSGQPGPAVLEAAPGSPAAMAGLQPGDLLLSLNQNPIPSLQMLIRHLQPCQPGDWITLEYLRSAEKSRAFLQVGHDPAVIFDRLEYLDGRAGAISLRRTGFQGVVQHDIVLDPKHCGGLLISSAGRIVGWNVARRARESSLGLSLRAIQDEVQKAAETARM
ncbi:MAG: trypsin-like peptidase domain-containing protein [Planctomycetota bacterium]